MNLITSLPITPTVNVQIALFPLGSRASQVTFVCPISNWLPDSMLQVTAGVSSILSVAGGSSQTTSAVDRPDVVVFVWFAGQEINVGSSISEYTYI